MNPTAEQTNVLDLFTAGGQLVVEAGAGTGKTTTLKMVADSTPRTGLYLAFNKAIVTEAGRKMPANMRVSTAHSLAFQAHGKTMAHRLNGKRMASRDVAKLLRLQQFGPLPVAGTTKWLAAGYLAGLVMRTIGRFCQSADEQPGPEHVPYVDGIDDTIPGPNGPRRGHAHNDALARHLTPALQLAWADLCDPNGQLRYDHGCYLKQWQLTHPSIGTDFILVDEAQDMNPVMRAIVLDQTDAQKVWVGDTQQQIYAWNGAINAMAAVDADRAYLTQSFRFGPPIAAVANRVLGALDAPLRITGLDSIDSTVGPVPDPDVILCRTNATAVSTVLGMQQAGRRVALVGGATEVVAFARAALELQQKGWTPHPELACFDTWAEVVAYVDQDELGRELALMVGLVEDYTPQVIIDALGQTIPEEVADVIVSTAHKAKGREWSRVRLAGDFPEPQQRGDQAEELRLVYVAATRARHQLDVSAVPFFFTARQEVVA